MRKRTLLFGRSLKAVLFLAAVSICSMSARAQYEIRPGTARLQVNDQESCSLCKNYLGENRGRISVNNLLNENVFMFDIVAGGYVMALNHQKTADYEKGTYVFANITPKNVLDEVKENYYLDPNPDLTGLLLTVEAIRIKNILYVTNHEPVDDISKLDELVQAGTIKKVDLKKGSNFIFSFRKIDEHSIYSFRPQNGGQVVYDLIKGRIMVIFEETAQTSNIFSYEAVDDPNNFDNILYHRFNFGNGDGPYTLEFSRSANENDKLFESALGENEYDKLDSLGNKISFLGVDNIVLYPGMNPAFYVDTAYINRGTGLIKPQYMLAVGTYIANECSESNAECANGEYVIGRYLYNASMYANEVPDETHDKSNNFNITQRILTKTRTPNGQNYLFNNMTRLAFSWAIHKGDSLYVLKGTGLSPWYRGTENDSYLLWMTLTKEYGVEGKSIDFSKLISENIIPESEYEAAYYYYYLSEDDVQVDMRTYYDYKPVTDLSPGKTIGLQAIVALDDNTHKDWVFSFPILEKGVASTCIESETTDRNRTFGSVINPRYGGWLTQHRGVPCISRTTREDLTNGVSVYTFKQTDASPVHNENTEAGELAAKATVIGGAESVIIQNAAGKRITISNLLGQTIVRTKASSDNLSVSVPAGIVIVNIEGEKTTKVIVK